ncbi:hypothetical protein SAMN05444959_10872 [Paracoccus seriniphilus]|uniref:Uncharacterized protein n=1 Tax=Paracoccus seriniphilus TaxID=184748 RepID=A0A239PWC6_9RHOB|nr:hypothetical protein SAMN05444959_10872 [Paracoccus seriniphilus]
MFLPVLRGGSGCRIGKACLMNPGKSCVSNRRTVVFRSLFKPGQVWGDPFLKCVISVARARPDEGPGGLLADPQHHLDGGDALGRLFEHLEEGNSGAVCDSRHAGLEREEGKPVGGILTRSADGGQFRLSKAGGDPENALCLQPSQIGHDLAQMDVVGGFQLFLDQPDRAVHRVSRSDIRR